MDDDLIGIIEDDFGRCFQIDGGGQHAAVLMVGVVAADFRASGRGKEEVLFHESVPPCILVLPASGMHLLFSFAACLLALF